MKTTPIVAWILGALIVWVPIYESRCKPNDSWTQIIGTGVFSMAWPVVLIGRVAVASWNPQMAMKSLGCEPAPAVSMK